MRIKSIAKFEAAGHKTTSPVYLEFMAAHSAGWVTVEGGEGAAGASITPP